MIRALDRGAELRGGVTFAPPCAIAYQRAEMSDQISVARGGANKPITAPIAKKEGTMLKIWISAAVMAIGGAPAMAQDAAAGAANFNKCKACHSIIAPDGTEIVKGGKTGPNLYGVIGRTVASDLDFSYGDSILAAGASGAVWDEASFAAYTADPKAWLAEKTGDSAAKSKMSFKLADGAADIAAYLVSVSQ